MGIRKEVGKRKIREGREMQINLVRTLVRETRSLERRLNSHASYEVGIILLIFSLRFNMPNAC